MASYKIDLHTHSMFSPDGGIRSSQYRQLLQMRKLDAVAITDHNTIDFAQQLHAELGDRIIVGEEITTAQGEIIGLYLTSAIQPFLSIEETVQAIQAQGGLVYVPHPFETVRKGLSHAHLLTIATGVDIVEIRNGRAVFQDRSKLAKAWAADHAIPGAASSDAHGMAGIAKTYTIVQEMPTRDNLVDLLHDAQLITGFVGVRGMMYPKFNRLRKWNWNV